MAHSSGQRRAHKRSSRAVWNEPIVHIARSSGLPLVGAAPPPPTKSPPGKVRLPHLQLPHAQTAPAGSSRAVPATLRAVDDHRGSEERRAGGGSEAARWLEGGEEFAGRLHAILADLDLKQNAVEASLNASKQALSLLKRLAEDLCQKSDSPREQWQLHSQKRWQMQTRGKLIVSMSDALWSSLFSTSEEAQKVAETACRTIYAVSSGHLLHRELIPGEVPPGFHDIETVNKWRLQGLPPSRRDRQSLLSLGGRQESDPDFFHFRKMSSEGDTTDSESSFDDEPQVGFPWQVLSNVQRLRLKQVHEKIRLGENICNTLGGQQRAAYSVLGMVQELTTGALLGWIWAFWRILWHEAKTSRLQIQTVSHSRKIHKKILCIVTKAWHVFAMGEKMNRTMRDTRAKIMDARVMAVHLRDVQDIMAETRNDCKFEKMSHLWLDKKRIRLEADAFSLRERLEATPPKVLRRSLYRVMELFTATLGECTSLRHLQRRKNFLSKEVLFLSVTSTESAEDINNLPCKEVLTRWINFLLLEAKHRASSLMGGDLETVEEGRQNWQPGENMKNQSRCREIRSTSLVSEDDFASSFEDGKIFAVLYAIIRSCRQGKAGRFSPSDLEPLDEKSTESRVVVSHSYFTSLLDTSVARRFLQVGDLQNIGQHEQSLLLYLAAFFLREAPCLDGITEEDDSFKTYLNEMKDPYLSEQRRRSSAMLTRSASKEVPAAIERDKQQQQAEREALEKDFPMAKIMHKFEEMVCHSAYLETSDASRLLLPGEEIPDLHAMNLLELLLRWVNLQVHGSVFPKGKSVRNFGKDLKNGKVLLKLIQTVAPQIFEAESKELEDEEESSPIKRVMQLASRCVPSCFLTEEAFHSCQEDVFAGFVASLFAEWPNLRPLPGSGLHAHLKRVEKVLQAGMNVLSISEDKAVSGAFNLLGVFCLACNADNRLEQAISKAEAQQAAIAKINKRIRTFTGEILSRKVFGRLQFRGKRSAAAEGQDVADLTLRELLREEGWKAFTREEHPATRSLQVLSTFRSNLRLIADIVNLYAISDADGQPQLFWSGIAHLHRDCHLCCPCLFLTAADAARIFLEVLKAEDGENPEPEIARMELDQMEQAAVPDREVVWEDMGITTSGFVRYLLRILLHKEEQASRAGIASETFSRSLTELINGHLVKSAHHVEQEEPGDFVMLSNMKEVRPLQENWEPLLRAAFELFADLGKDPASSKEEPLRMSEDYFVNMLASVHMLGPSLTEEAARSVFQNMLHLRHFRPSYEEFCDLGRDQVMHQQQRQKLKRINSLPARLQGAVPFMAELRSTASERSNAMYFEDFQQTLIASALYHNPNLLVPVHQRYEQFLSALAAGLVKIILGEGEVEPALPEHLNLKENRAQEFQAKRRAWQQLKVGLEAYSHGSTSSWKRRVNKDRKAMAKFMDRRSSSMPRLSVPSNPGEENAMVQKTRTAFAVRGVSRPTEGTLDGLGQGEGTRHATVWELQKAVLKFGGNADASTFQRKLTGSANRF